MKLNRNTSNLFYLFLIEFSIKIISFAAMPYLARVLGTSGFGIISISMGILSYAIIFGNSGLSLIGLRKAAGSQESSDQFLSDITLSRLILSVVSFIAAIGITYLVFSREIFLTSLFYLLYLFPLALTIDWLFQGEQKMGRIAAGKIIGMVSYLAIILIFVKSPDDIQEAGAAWSIGGFINMGFLLIYFLSEGRLLKLKSNLSRIKSTIKESLSLGVAAIIGEIIVIFPIIFLGIISSTEEAGIYSAAFRVIVLFLAVDRIFNAFFFPKIVKYAQQNGKEIETIFNLILKILSVASVIICIGIIYFAREMIYVIFGNEYAASVLVLQILSGLFLFAMMNSVFTYTLIGIKKEKIYTFSMLWGSLIFFLISSLSFVVNPILIIAIALTAFQITTLVYMSIKLSMEIKIRFLKSIVWPVSAIPAGAFLLHFMSPSVSLKIVIFILLSAYSILVSGFGKKEIEMLKRTFV